MLKPFRILHLPLLIIIVVLFFMVLFYLSFNKPVVFPSHENSISSTGASSNRNFLLNFNTRDSLLFYKRGGGQSKANHEVKSEFNFDKSIFPGFKFVHLDLKGAPPKVSYLIGLFPLLQSLGATGLLVEYEDAFPYSSADVSAKNAYTKQEVIQLLTSAKESGLQVIPLLQTFGHAEFILKLKDYKHLREVPKYPQAFCPSLNETNELIQLMIDDIMELHSDAKYFHIGCDEVFQLASCERCQSRLARNKWSKKELFFSHVAKTASYIKEKYPKVKVLMWDDEMRGVSIPELQEFGIGDLIEPVVWKYTPYVTESFKHTLWTKYSTVFKNVWIASAFKGASSSDSYSVDIELYMANHQSWMDAVKKYSKYVNFKGAILTGWQRYDHFAILCELLPVAIPSLAVNLAYLSGPDSSIEKAAHRVKTMLKCEISPLLMDNSRVTNHCVFPGSGVYESISVLQYLVNEINSVKENSVYKGWIHYYNIKTGFSNPYLVEGLEKKVDEITSEMLSLEMKIVEAMDPIYDKATIDEWLFTNLKPHQDEIKRISKAINQLLAKDEWPLRPFNFPSN